MYDFCEGKKNYNRTHGFFVFILAVLTVKWSTPFKYLKCGVVCRCWLYIDV